MTEAAARKPRRSDGWSNAFTGVGSLSYDKRTAGEHLTAVVSRGAAADLWRGNPLAARIVEAWPNEMVRQGWDLLVADPDVDANELSDLVSDKLEELDLVDALWTGLAYERCYGGGANLIGVDDGQALDKPLNLDAVKSISWMTTFEPDEIYPVYWYADPRAAKFGQPSHYDIFTAAMGPSADKEPDHNPIRVHESRIIAYPGIRVSRAYQQGTSHGWGDSVMTRVNGILRDHGMGFDAAAILLHDFAQAIYKIKGLADAMANDRDDEILNRTRAVELSRSTARAIIIDAEEEFQREQTPVTGLPELLDRFNAMLAAAADMPLTLMMGTSPGGLNATGESDIRFFYDRVRAAQIRKLKPAIERIVRIVLRSMGREPKQWSIEFRPLWQQSDKEKAESRYIQAQADQLYIGSGVMGAEDVARSRFGGDEYSFDTTIDMEARAKLEAEMHALEVEAMKPPPVAPAKPAAKPAK